MSIEKRSLTLTINGQKVGPVDAPVGMPMIDFLHDHLDLTGTRFGCGQGICHLQSADLKVRRHLR